jgi:hypothetical protein
MNADSAPIVHQGCSFAGYPGTLLSGCTNGQVIEDHRFSNSFHQKESSVNHRPLGYEPKVTPLTGSDFNRLTQAKTKKQA